MFTDIGHLSREAQEAILWCAKAGQIKGVGDGKFAPDAPLTRWQEALLTYRSLNFAKLAVAKYRPNTVTLFNTNTLKTGAGFFLNQRGDILTNKHVVLGRTGDDTVDRPYPWTQYIKSVWGMVRADWMSPDPAIIYDPNDPTDLAVVRMHQMHRANLPDILPVIPLDNDEPIEGERCVAIGSPLSYSNWVSEGIVSLYPIERTEVDGSTSRWAGVTAAINPGNSGGPVISLDERVLGVATLKPWYNSGGWGMTHGDDMGLILVASEVKRWLDKRGIPFDAGTA